MILIIQEYLSQLKESKELDKLLPDLLLSMGHTPISIPQVGVRQYGVDIASESFDEKKNKILYLFIVKQGDVGRSDWDSTPQSIRQALNEIKDIYLKKVISADQEALLKRIILCTSGVLKQEVEINWKGYMDQNIVRNELEYELWDGFRLAKYIEEHMLNENILLDSFKSKFRKTLALLGDPDYDLSDYHAILKENLLTAGENNKKTKKILYSIRLILNIIYDWSKKNNNLKPALYAAEKTILNLWELFRKYSFFDNKDFLKIFSSFFHDFTKIYTDYYKKIYQYCYIKNGLNGYSGYYLLENINIYEQLGIIAIVGLNNFYFGAMYSNEDIIHIAENVKESLKAFIDNHKSASSPVYDNHIIEIILALILLGNFNEYDYIEKWITEIVSRIKFSYVALGKYFPVDTDSFEDAVLLLNADEEVKKKLMLSSTMLLILLQFSAVLRLNNLYTEIKEVINNIFTETTLQIWFPDNITDEYLYIDNAGNSSGLAFVPTSLPDNAEEMNKLILESNEKYMNKDSISAVKNGFMILPLIASRHFRTPILPLYWAMYIDVEKST